MPLATVFLGATPRGLNVCCCHNSSTKRYSLCTLTYFKAGETFYSPAKAWQMVQESSTPAQLLVQQLPVISSLAE